MIHRHLDYTADTPVAARGDAAMDDVLERGDLNDWQPLLRAIAAEPFGTVAECVLRLCDANPRYGTSPLWRAWIGRRRALAEGEAIVQRRAVAHPGAPVDVPDVSLADLRRRCGLSQQALADRIGMSQSDLSKAERRSDWRISTVTSIVVGMGLRARVVVTDADGRDVAAIRGAGRD